MACSSRTSSTRARSLFVDQPAQLMQQIDAEEGAPPGHRHQRVRRADIRPFDQQRAQPPLRVQIGHAVSAPVVAHSKDVESLSPQRMERMCDGENFCATATTVCNARFSPKARWNPGSSTCGATFCAAYKAIGEPYQQQSGHPPRVGRGGRHCAEADQQRKKSDRGVRVAGISGSGDFG
jgi:hypothetical protein